MVDQDVVKGDVASHLLCCDMQDSRSNFFHNELLAVATFYGHSALSNVEAFASVPCGMCGGTPVNHPVVTNALITSVSGENVC